MDIRTSKAAAVGAAIWVTARQALAADTAAVGEGMGVLTVVFLVLAAVVIVGQVIPAIVMFGSMLLGLFSAEGRRARKEKKADQAF